MSHQVTMSLWFHRDIQLPMPLGKSVVGAWRFDLFKGFKCFLLKRNLHKQIFICLTNPNSLVYHNLFLITYFLIYFIKPRLFLWKKNSGCLLYFNIQLIVLTLIKSKIDVYWITILFNIVSLHLFLKLHLSLHGR